MKLTERLLYFNNYKLSIQGSSLEAADFAVKYKALQHHKLSGNQ